jgi:hypothetical protein
MYSRLEAASINALVTKWHTRYARRPISFGVETSSATPHLSFLHIPSISSVDTTSSSLHIPFIVSLDTNSLIMATNNENNRAFTTFEAAFLLLAG